MWPFKRRTRKAVESRPPELTADQMLLQALLESERFRVEKSAELESKKHDLEMRKYELELHELERLGEEKRKQQVFNENVRELRRKGLEKARELKKQKELAVKQGAAGNAALEASKYDGCEECRALAEGREPRHSSHLMRHKTENHAARWLHN